MTLVIDKAYKENNKKLRNENVGVPWVSFLMLNFFLQKFLLRVSFQILLNAVILSNCV